MASTREKRERARWLTKDGRTSMFAAADVENAKAAGWKDPEAPRANGEPWNPEADPVERTQLDAIEATHAARAERDEKRAERQAQAASDELAAREAAGEADPGISSALKVEVVNAGDLAADQKSATKKKSAK